MTAGDSGDHDLRSRIFEILKRSSAETHPWPVVLRELGLEQSFFALDYTPPDRPRNVPPEGTMMTSEEWAAHRKALHAAMLARSEILGLRKFLYDHPSKGRPRQELPPYMQKRKRIKRKPNL